MPLRLLVIGDQHFQTNNIAEVNIFLAKLKAWLDEHANEIDICISMGDLCHEHARLHISPLNKAIEYIRLLASYKPTYVLVGNHDACGNSIFLTTDHWLNCLKGHQNVTVVDTVLIKTIKGQKIVLCPYVPDGRFIEALNTHKGEWEDSRCIFSHITIKGAMGDEGEIMTRNADEWDEKYPMLISGHIHLQHWVHSNMYYTGSIMQVAVNEDPKKSIAVVDVNNEGLPTIEQINLHLPKKCILEIDITDIEDFKMPCDPDTKYMLYISGSYEEYKAFRKSTLFKSLVILPQLQNGSKGIKHKPKKIETKATLKKMEDLRGCKLRHFDDILLESIQQENDGLLYSFYRNVVYDETEDLSELLEDVLVITKK